MPSAGGSKENPLCGHEEAKQVRTSKVSTGSDGRETMQEEVPYDVVRWRE